MSFDFSLFAAADIHALDGNSNLTSVLSLVKNDPDAVQPDTFLLGGDLVGAVGGGARKGPPPPRKDDGKPFTMRMSPEELRRWQPTFSVDDVRREITDLYGEGVKTYFTYGSHDKNEVDGAAKFLSGLVSPGGYHLYGISFVAMRCADSAQIEEMHYDGPDIGVGAADRNAAAFLDAMAALPDSDPVFVMSHIPLHYHRNDNRGAYLWAEALNEAAKKRPVFVFFAHNHTAEQRTSLDRQYYFVPAGSVLPVQGCEKEERHDVTISFTYLNAGYIVKGCGTLLTRRGDELTIRRYSLTEPNDTFGGTNYVNPQIIRL